MSSPGGFLPLGGFFGEIFLEGEFSERKFFSCGGSLRQGILLGGFFSRGGIILVGLLLEGDSPRGILKEGNYTGGGIIHKPLLLLLDNALLTKEVLNNLIK